MRFFWWVAVLSSVCACGGGTAQVDPSRCVPGQQIACACANSPASVQVCQEDGTYAACQCSSAIGTGGSGPTIIGSGRAGSPSAGGASQMMPDPGGFGAASSSGGSATGLIDYRYGDTSPCDAHDNSIFFDGEGGDYIHPGQDFLTIARFTDQSSSSHISFDIEPSGAEHGLWWWVDFSSEKLGEPLNLGEYLNAERYPFETYLKPGMDVSGDGRGCNTLTGKFLVTDLRWVGGTLVRFSASFEQHCEGGSAALRGCIHYDSGLLPESGTGGAAGAAGAASAGDDDSGAAGQGGFAEAGSPSN